MDFLILLGACVLLYAVLRSFGGKGADIKFQLQPSNTTKGKRDRAILGGSVAVAILAVVYVILTPDETRSRYSTIAIVLLGGAIFLASYLVARRPKK
jgi:hypothetical protein